MRVSHDDKALMPPYLVFILIITQMQEDILWNNNTMMVSNANAPEFPQEKQTFLEAASKCVEKKKCTTL